MNFLANVPFVTYMNSIMKATSDDDKPIPGYLYEISFESAENCETLCSCLVDRLQSDSTNVKLKVLKLMKYIVENGHQNFRLGLLKKSTGIKEATKHSGPPDPLHGNVPYLMVRKIAKNLSEMLFNQDTATTSPVRQETTISTMGIGPSNVSDRNKSMKMEGFGNTSAVQNKSLSGNIKEGLLNLVDRMGETSADTQQKQVLSTIETTGYIPPSDDLYQVSTSQDTLITRDDSTTRVKAISPPKHIPGKAGGGWDDSDDDGDADDGDADDGDADDGDADDDDGNTEHSNVKSDLSGSCTTERLECNLEQDFTTEYNLVQEMISDTTKDSTLLTRSQLKNFIKNCGNLNCDKVVEILKLNLSSDTDIPTMRCLMMLESLMNTDLVNLDRIVHVCKDSMINLVKKRSGIIQIKAEKLIRILEKLSSYQRILDDEYKTLL
ncbi:AP-4 complex accessory subunit Tepsin [Mactra antiquata]